MDLSQLGVDIIHPGIHPGHRPHIKQLHEVVHNALKYCSCRLFLLHFTLNNVQNLPYLHLISSIPKIDKCPITTT